MSEILICDYCNCEYDVNYSFRNDEEIVSQTNCGCDKKSKIKSLDNINKQLEELLNERDFNRTY